MGMRSTCFLTFSSPSILSLLKPWQEVREISQISISKVNMRSPPEFFPSLVKITVSFQAHKYIFLQFLKDICPLILALNGKSNDDADYISFSGFQK